MPLTLDQCISKIKEIYPDMYPTYWITYEDKYFFSLAPRGVERDLATIDIHMVNPEDGGVSGSIPLNILMKDPKIVSLLKNPHKISPSDQQIEHSIFLRNNRDSLSHHGILGQKWGVRRFQNDDGSLTPEGIERYRTGKKNNISNGPEGMDPVTAYYAAEAVATVAFCIGASVYSRIKRNRNHQKWKDQNDAISEDYLSDISDIRDFSKDNKPKTIQGEHSREEDMAAINPKYGLAIKGNTNNCVLCSAAYDLRRRGYDVTAKLCDTGMYTDKVVKEMYENAKTEDVGGRNWSSVYRKCENKYPEGARGIISVNCIFGGHAMAFEIEGGKMQIYDAQSAKKRKLTDEELSIFDPQYTRCTRLDNKEVKWEGAKIACAELKPDWKMTVARQKKESEKKSSKETTPSDNKVAAGSKFAMSAKQIAAYRKEHPNSKLTDKEIWNNLQGG